MATQDDVSHDEKYTIVHDHGFVGFIDYMGSDEAVEEAARVSYGAGTRKISETRNLVRYLMRHRHTSPFEMCEVKFHLKVPIFVMRQLVRHRTASLNEYSGRYSVMTDEFYIPELEYIQPQSQTNKQGREENAWTKYEKIELQRAFRRQSFNSYKEYKKLLKQNLSREISRTLLPVSNYTELYWKIDIHNFLHFASLRADSHAQKEIQDYTIAMYDLVKPKFPLIFEAYEDYARYGVKLSKMEKEIVKDALNGKEIQDRKHYNMSKREWEEFWGEFNEK